jgi:putative sigma-54 modulation protein
MKMNIHGKNKFEVKPGLREYIEEKVQSFVKLFNNTDGLSVNVVCKEYGDKKVVEITIPTKHLILRAEASTEDMFNSVDTCINKLEKQLLKHRKKINSMIRARDGIAGYFSEQFENIEAEEDEREVVRNKEVFLEVMSIEEAKLQLDLLAHDFYMFINSEDHKVTLIYLRGDGNYGVMKVR